MDGEGYSIARCNFKESTFAIQLRMESSFNDICREIQSLFGGVVMNIFELKYSFNFGTKCNLSCDRDVHMMFISQRIAKSDFIDIELLDTSNNECDLEIVQGGGVVEHGDPISDFDPRCLVFLCLKKSCQ